MAAAVPFIVCETKIDFCPFAFEWRINNFPVHFSKDGDCLDSRSFEAGSRRWYLTARRQTKNDKDCFGIYLHLKEGKDVKTDFTISLISNGKKVLARASSAEGREFTKRRDTSTGAGSGWGYVDFISFSSLMDEKNEYLEKITDCVTIRVVGRVFESTENEINDKEKHSPNDVQQRMFENLSLDLGSNLLFNSSLSDFTIKAENKEFRVHKPILAARSDFFAALFASGMKETSVNEIVVEDIGADALQVFIRFIYTGKVEELEGLELELFQAADKYQVEGLKELAERALCMTLSAANAFELLVYADRHSAEQLKTETIQFIGRNRGEVVKSDCWRQLHAMHPRLVGELFTSVAGERKRRAVQMSSDDDD